MVAVAAQEADKAAVSGASEDRKGHSNGSEDVTGNLVEEEPQVADEDQGGLGGQGDPQSAHGRCCPRVPGRTVQAGTAHHGVQPRGRTALTSAPVEELRAVGPAGSAPWSTLQREGAWAADHGHRLRRNPVEAEGARTPPPPRDLSPQGLCVLVLPTDSRSWVVASDVGQEGPA